MFNSYIIHTLLIVYHTLPIHISYKLFIIRTFDYVLRCISKELVTLVIYKLFIIFYYIFYILHGVPFVHSTTVHYIVQCTLYTMYNTLFTVTSNYIMNVYILCIFMCNIRYTGSLHLLRNTPYH